MTLLWHLIAADLRRHHLVLIAWLVVIAATATLEAVTPMLASNVSVGVSISLLASLLWLTEWLLMVFVVALVIQTHPLVGSNAFWMTRPIRPGMLQASKMAMLATFMVGVPMIAGVVVMAVYHVPTRHVLAVSVDTVIFRSSWLTAVTIVAALTPTLARFALACAGVLGAFAVALATTISIALARIDDAPTIAPMQMWDPTSDVVLLVLGIASGIALLFVQYQTRSRMQSVVIGVAGVSAAILAAEAWPWPLLSRRLEVPIWAAAPDWPRLVARPDTVKARDPVEGMARRAKWRSIAAGLHIDGVPVGWSSQVVLLEATLNVPGKGRLVSAAYGSAPVPSLDGKPNPVNEVVRAALGVQRLVHRGSPSGESIPVLTIQDSDFRRFMSSVGEYRGRFQIVPTRYEIEARLPLRAGAMHQRDAYRIVIENVEFASGTTAIEVRASNATAMLDRHPRPERTYYLRNEQLSEAMEGVASSPHLGWGLVPGFYSSEPTLGFTAQRLDVEFIPRYDLPGPMFTIDQRWLEGAELVIVRATDARTFERTLEMPAFPLREPPKPTAQENDGGAQR